MLPCGMPDKTGKKLEYEPSRHTLASVVKIRTEPEPEISSNTKLPELEK